MFDTTNKSTTGIIKYNYLESVIYPTYKKTTQKDKYIELPYLGNPSYPNLVLGNTLYNTSKIYIYGKLHSIKDLDYDGELVIEHIAITNWGGKVFTCIPLKTTNGIADTTLDQIISMTNQSTALSLNPLLQQSANTNAIIYNDTGFFTSNNTVIVLLKPVYVRNGFADFALSNNGLFDTTGPATTGKYETIHMVQQSGRLDDPPAPITAQPRIESFTEGNDGSKCQKMPEKVPDSDVYISCKPSDVSTEDVQSFNMPLTSDMIKDNEHLKMMKNTMALFTVIFIFGAVSFFVPMIYQSLVINEIMNFYLKQTYESTNGKSEGEYKKERIYQRMMSVDVLISVAIMFLSFGLIYDGAKTHSSVEKSFGMLVGGLYILGWFMISNKRLEPNYYKGILAKIPGYEVKAGTFDDVPSITNADVLIMIMDMMALLGKNMTSAMAFAFVLFLIVLSTHNNSPHPSSAWFILCYGLFFSIYFIYLIDQYHALFDK
jgi:hypothetical protein